MRLTHSQPRSGAKWTDSSKSRERRELKHRAAGDSRLVPVHPELVTLLRDHLDHTTCATPRCRPGLTRAFPPPRWPSGPGTAPTYCYASTSSASPASRAKRSAASRMPCVRWRPTSRAIRASDPARSTPMQSTQAFEISPRILSIATRMQSPRAGYSRLPRQRAGAAPIMRSCRSKAVFAGRERRVRDSNPRGRVNALAVLKTAKPMQLTCVNALAQRESGHAFGMVSPRAARRARRPSAAALTSN